MERISVILTLQPSIPKLTGLPAARLSLSQTSSVKRRGVLERNEIRGIHSRTESCCVSIIHIRNVEGQLEIQSIAAKQVQ